MFLSNVIGYVFSVHSDTSQGSHQSPPARRTILRNLVFPLLPFHEHGALTSDWIYILRLYMCICFGWKILFFMNIRLSGNCGQLNVYAPRNSTPCCNFWISISRLTEVCSTMTFMISGIYSSKVWASFRLATMHEKVLFHLLLYTGTPLTKGNAWWEIQFWSSRHASAQLQVQLVILWEDGQPSYACD